MIFHSVTAPLEVGSIVSGKINWKERFEKMQQHTGEHIVSGIVHERFGYNNVGFIWEPTIVPWILTDRSVKRS